MSTKASYSYRSIGECAKGNQCAWHVYHECLDDTFRLTVTLWSHDVLSHLRIPQRVAYWFARVIG